MNPLNSRLAATDPRGSQIFLSALNSPLRMLQSFWVTVPMAWSANPLPVAMYEATPSPMVTGLKVSQPVRAIGIRNAPASLAHRKIRSP